MSKKIKEQVEGITLIALVVTIIILLILSGVAINLSIGSNGIFIRVQESVEEYNKKQKEEEVNMYWGEAQLNYKDTIEKQVEYLQDKMRKQDPSATAVINGEIIDVTYKGYSMKLEYKDTKNEEKINYFNVFISDNSIIKMYTTKNGKIYVEDDENKICMNDKYPEIGLSQLNVIGTSDTFCLFNNKKLWGLVINNMQDIKLEKYLDLETVDGGKYKDKNIKSFFEVVLLDDGKMYVPSPENTLIEFQIPQLENTKFNNLGLIVDNNKNITVMIDEQGKMYNPDTKEDISLNYANGFFKDKKIKYCTTITMKSIYYNAFITENGKLYLVDSNTKEVAFSSEENETLKNKKITNIYYLGNDFEEQYSEIITEDGMCYYTEDFENYHDINLEGFPNVTMKLN